MTSIKMVDLERQYAHLEMEIDDAIKRVISSSAFIKGPDVKAFEQELGEYLNVKHVIGCANGTDALQLALMALNLEPGDEVITPDFTFIATVEVIALLGLKPVLVDVDSNDFTIDIDEIKKAITPKTKAIIPVHLFGQCANMEDIMQIAAEHKLHVIEDTAQALGASFIFSNGKQKKAGTIGDIGATSFFPSKNLGCFGDGGAVFTNNDDMAEEIRAMANHGMKKKYQYHTIGVNSRLDTIQAAVLRIKLKYLDHYNQTRRASADYYDLILGQMEEVITPFRNGYSTHIFHQYTLKVENNQRDALREYLLNHNIPNMVYYPKPLHGQQAYSRYIDKGTSYTITDMLTKQVLSLPMHTELTEDELNFITQTILNYFQ